MEWTLDALLRLGALKGWSVAPIKDKNEARIALEHEVVGHLGLEGVLGKKKFNVAIRIGLISTKRARANFTNISTPMEKY